MIIVRLVCVHRHRHHAGNFERFRLRRVFFCCSLFRISLPMEITSSCVYNNVVAVCGRTTTARADPSSSLTPCCNKCVSFFFAGHARYTRSHTGDYWWVIAGYRASACRLPPMAVNDMLVWRTCVLYGIWLKLHSNASQIT